MKSLHKVLLASFAFLGLCAFAGRSEAAFQVTISATGTFTNTNSFTIMDGVNFTGATAGDDPTNDPNVIDARGAGGTTGVRFGITGTANNNAYFSVSLNSTTTSSADPYTLATNFTVLYHPASGAGAAILTGTNIAKLTSTIFTITVTDTGLTAPAGSQITLSNTFSGTSSNLNYSAGASTVSYAVNAGSLNSTAGLSFTSNSSPNNNPSATTGLVPNPYNVTTTFTIAPRFTNNLIQGQQLSITSQADLATLVPAPPALLLGVIGLPALALARRFRKNANTLAA